MKKKYRIYESHCGDASTLLKHIYAKDDEEASAVFELMKKDPCYGYSYLSIYQVVQEEILKPI